MRAFRLAIFAIVVPAIVGAQATVAKPGAEISKLASQVVGTWSYEGTSKANPYSPAGKVTGTDVYEIGPGGFSVSHKWEEQDPFGHVTGLEVFAWDASKKTLVGSYYTSLGEVGGGPITAAGGVYTYPSTGVTWEGKQAWSKCTWTFEGSKTIKVKCDASSDGKTWMSGAFEGTWTKK